MLSLYISLYESHLPEVGVFSHAKVYLGWFLLLAGQLLGGCRSPDTGSVRVPQLTAYEALASGLGGFSM